MNTKGIILGLCFLTSFAWAMEEEFRTPPQSPRAAARSPRTPVESPRAAAASPKAAAASPLRSPRSLISKKGKDLTGERKRQVAETIEEARRLTSRIREISYIPRTAQTDAIMAEIEDDFASLEDRLRLHPRDRMKSHRRYLDQIGKGIYDYYHPHGEFGDDE